MRSSRGRVAAHRVAQPRLGLGAPVRDTVRPLAVTAEDLVPGESLECQGPVAGARRVVQRGAGVHDVEPQRGQVGVPVEELDVLVALLDQGQHRVGVAGADRLGEAA